MKRLHLHMSVPDLAQSISFYEALFGAGPSVVKADYAKWMLDDPKVNFAISARGLAGGVDHVGIQVDSPAELSELAGRLKAAGNVTLDQVATTCCYAQSDKSWVSDPAGVRWETFYTFGEATAYGKDVGDIPVSAGLACCGAAAVAPVEPVKVSSCC